MKRIFVLFTTAAMMTMMALSAGPALAQVVGIGDSENESGDIETENNFAIEGNNNNACLGQLQFGQSGNFTNQQGTLEFFSPFDDNEFAGGDIEFAPENETGCEQSVEQAAAASSWSW